MKLHSSYPFWMIREGLMNSFPTLREDLKTDVVIIGGGITAALVAHEFTQSGIGVIVLDKRHVAHGSTSASTAMLQYENDVPMFKMAEMIGRQQAIKVFRRSVEAIERIGEISASLPGEVHFEKCPSLWYASYRKHVDELILPEFHMRKKEGFDVELLEETEFETKMGFRKAAGIWSAQGAHVNPYRLCQELFSEVRKNGSQVFDSIEVTEIRPGRGKVMVRTKDGPVVTAAHAIVACGYESERFLERKVAQLKSTYAIVSKPFPGNVDLWTDNAMLWETKTPYLYMRTTGDRRILVGGHDEDFSSLALRDKKVNSKASRLEADFKKLFPELQFEPDFSWAGTFGETKDGLPYIGSEKHERIHFALGYGGNGIVFSVLAAEILREAVRGRKHPDAPLFGFNR